MAGCFQGATHFCILASRIQTPRSDHNDKQGHGMGHTYMTFALEGWFEKSRWKNLGCMNSVSDEGEVGPKILKNCGHHMWMVSLSARLNSFSHGGHKIDQRANELQRRCRVAKLTRFVLVSRLSMSRSGLGRPGLVGIGNQLFLAAYDLKIAD